MEIRSIVRLGLLNSSIAVSPSPKGGARYNRTSRAGRRINSERRAGRKSKETWECSTIQRIASWASSSPNAPPGCCGGEASSLYSYGASEGWHRHDNRMHGTGGRIGNGGSIQAVQGSIRRSAVHPPVPCML